MTPNRSQHRVPSLAAWLIGLFAASGNAEPIAGDLLEEFSKMSSAWGAKAARRWYWKQSLKTSAHLFWTSLRSAPGLIAGVTIGGFFFLWATQWFPSRLVFGVLDHDPGIFEAHYGVWLFCTHYGIQIVGWIVAVLLGCFIGIVARGREIVATAAFGVFRIVGAPTLTIALFWVFRALFPHDHFMAWNTTYIGVIVMRGVNFAEAYRQGYGRIGLLFLYFIQPFASVLLPILGGLLVRKIRSFSSEPPLVPAN